MYLSSLLNSICNTDYLYLAIWLSRFKCGLGDIVNGVKNLDESMFEKDQLKGLIPLLPTSEDVCVRVVV